MAIEKFESRLMHGSFNVTCKFDDGSARVWNGRKETVVSQIQQIVDEYQRAGYTLTLRQLHYQFVSNVPGYINHDTAYKKLGRILDDCRYCGAIDWDAIEDRGRVPHLPYFVEDIPDALNDTINSYRLDLMRGQENYIEVWTEKDALSGIFRKSTDRFHVRLVVNKGYTSSSAIYDSYERLSDRISSGQSAKILYFGDHDPSGLDMVRDVRERLVMMFENGDRLGYEPTDDQFEIIPIGLTMAQIKKYKLPPNPTKMTDTRSDKYIAEFGKTCWEVDALRPDVLTEIVESNIKDLIDVGAFNDMVKQTKNDIKKLKSFIETNK